MFQPVLLTTPIPTPEELADELGVSRKRLKALGSLLRSQGLLAPAHSFNDARSSGAVKANKKSASLPGKNGPARKK